MHVWVYVRILSYTIYEQILEQLVQFDKTKGVGVNGVKAIQKAIRFPNFSAHFFTESTVPNGDPAKPGHAYKVEYIYIYIYIYI